MRTFHSLFSAVLLCGATLPMQGVGLPGAETVTPSEIASADRPAASREQAQTPSPAEQSQAEAIAAQTAAPQTVAPVTTVPALSGAQVRFAPVDGARFERLLSSQSSATANGDNLSIREIRTQVDERWEKSGENWLLHCTPTDASVQMSNNPLLASIQQIVLMEPYTITFNEAGEIISVSGFEGLAAKLIANTPKEWHEAIATGFTPEEQHNRVANSPTYQFQWLYGKRWNAGDVHSNAPTQLLTGGTTLSVSETYTVSAIDSSVLILAIDSGSEVIRKNNDLPAPSISAKGTATFDIASGLLRQLQTTGTNDSSRPAEDGTPVLAKHSEVINITWTKAE